MGSKNTIVMNKPESVRIDCYALTVLMRDLVGHDRRSAAYLVYLYLYTCTKSQAGKSVQASLQTIANQTGLSKASVSNALKWLRYRRLLETQRNGPTDVPSHKVMMPWRVGNR